MKSARHPIALAVCSIVEVRRSMKQPKIDYEFKVILRFAKRPRLADREIKASLLDALVDHCIEFDTLDVDEITVQGIRKTKATTFSNKGVRP
jgi:hypothetical protein